jgi:hypothetical protein
LPKIVALKAYWYLRAAKIITLKKNVTIAMAFVHAVEYLCKGDDAVKLWVAQSSEVQLLSA